MHVKTTQTRNKSWSSAGSDVHLVTPITLIEQGKEALEMYYKTIGQKYDADSRHFKHSQPRMAFGLALSRHIGDTLTADVIQKDRTTVIHYKKSHDANMFGWDGYDTYYETAEYVVNTYFDGMAKVNRIEYIDKIVNKLLKEKLSIQSKLNEQLQVQDH